MYFSNWNGNRVYVNEHKESPLYLCNGLSGIEFSKKLSLQQYREILDEIGGTWAGALARAKIDEDDLQRERELDGVVMESLHSDYGDRD